MFVHFLPTTTIIIAQFVRELGDIVVTSSMVSSLLTLADRQCVVYFCCDCSFLLFLDFGHVCPQ